MLQEVPVMPEFTATPPTQEGTYLAYGDPVHKPAHPYYRPRWSVVEVGLSANKRLMYFGFGLVLDFDERVYGGGPIKFCLLSNIVSAPLLTEG